MMPDPTERVPAERRAALLASLARSIAASLDLDTILQTVAEGARELCRSDLSAIALREPETGDMVFRFRSGARFHEGGRLTVETGRGAGGRVLDTGKPFRSDDLAEEPAFADDPGYREIVETRAHRHRHGRADHHRRADRGTALRGQPHRPDPSPTTTRRS